VSTLSDQSRPYVTISADCHAGAPTEKYREYLDPKYRERFDRWREERRNSAPAKPIKPMTGRETKNWNSTERFRDLEADGVCGEVIFPNTPAPFCDHVFVIAQPPPPERFELELAGTRAYNRWLAEWCQEAPERRAGIGAIHLNDIDEAIADVRWIAEHGLRGGVMVVTPAPDSELPPLYAPDYDRLWAVIQDCDLVLNQHGGAGSPDYGQYPASLPLWFLEVIFFSVRGYKQLILGGVFERFPKLRYILTEGGCAWVQPALAHMDALWKGMKTGSIGEIDFSRSFVLREPPSFYARRNCWYGASFPSPGEIAGYKELGADKILWGSDYPHSEGTFPHTRQALQLAFSAVDPADTRLMLGENAAHLYGFDLKALEPIAERVAVMPEHVREPLREIPTDTTCLMLRRAREGSHRVEDKPASHSMVQ
jgi:predicted TIM-barrel fold metal-dependent hydrolase